MEIRAEDGWRPCADSQGRSCRPDSYLSPVQFGRSEWAAPWSARWSDLRPETNLAGMYWRPIPLQQSPEDVTSVEPFSADTGSVAQEYGPSGWMPTPQRWNKLKQKHRIVHAWLTENGGLWVLGSDGRMFVRPPGHTEWIQISTYPPGLEP